MVVSHHDDFAFRGARADHWDGWNSGYTHHWISEGTADCTSAQPRSLGDGWTGNQCCNGHAGVYRSAPELHL